MVPNEFVTFEVSSQPNQLNISERSSTVKQLELHPAVASEVDNGLYSMRQHPGTIRKKCDELPSKLMEAMMVVASGCKKSDIFEEGNKLRNQLWGRHLPPEKHDYIMQLKKQRTKAQEAIAAINEVDEEMLSKLEEKVTTRLMQDTIHPWHPLDLSDRTCLLYLFSRTPAEYCILHKIFTELKQRDPNFSPSTLFDFGSGVASGYWAAKEVWKEPFKEVYNVDSNLNMNNLASQLLKIAGEKSCAEEGVYFRQFFPLSPRPTFDLTLSAFSLLELPSFKERMEAISRLWSKTNKYLVIVEDGTIAGYTAVMEARKLILYVESQKIGETSHINAHVAAPCPHEFNCPIISKEKRPCNFEVSYLLPQCLLGKQIRKSHLYSYVIVTRGARSNNDCQWSRCVNNTTLHKKQVHLKLCTPEGKLESVSLSKKYNSSNAYKCAKLTKWGDLLPGKIHDCDKTKLGDHK